MSPSKDFSSKVLKMHCKINWCNIILTKFKEWHWSAFAILAMHTWKFSQKLFVMQCHNFLQAWTLSCQHCYPGQVFAQLENSQYFVWIVVSKTIIKRHIIWSVILSVDNIAIQVKFFLNFKTINIFLTICETCYVENVVFKWTGAMNCYHPIVVPMVGNHWKHPSPKMSLRGLFWQTSENAL